MQIKELSINDYHQLRNDIYQKMIMLLIEDKDNNFEKVDNILYEALVKNRIEIVEADEMKKLFETDYVIYDKANDSPLQDSYGRVLLFGNKLEADDDCRGNEIVIPCTKMPIHWQNELINQISKH